MNGGRIVSLSEVSFGRFLSVSDHRKAGLEKSNVYSVEPIEESFFQVHSKDSLPPSRIFGGEIRRAGM